MIGLLSLAACSALLLTGCAPETSRAALSLDALDGDAAYGPRLTTIAYRAIDANVADVYLSDLPMARLTDPNDALTGARGTIVHIHLFLVPRAGRTPIAPDACNLLIRQVVLAGGPVGLYAGGGFALPSTRPGASRLAISLADSTLRLERASAGFDDRLGPATMTGTARAVRDDELAETLGARFDAIAAALPQLRTTEAAATTSPTTSP